MRGVPLLFPLGYCTTNAHQKKNSETISYPRKRIRVHNTKISPRRWCEGYVMGRRLQFDLESKTSCSISLLGLDSPCLPLKQNKFYFMEFPSHASIMNIVDVACSTAARAKKGQRSHDRAVAVASREGSKLSSTTSQECRSLSKRIFLIPFLKSPSCEI